MRRRPSDWLTFWGRERALSKKGGGEGRGRKKKSEHASSSFFFFSLSFFSIFDFRFSLFFREEKGALSLFLSLSLVSSPP